jgi:hypothetical protein
MADLWVVLTLVGFFALCVAFVRGCDRIIGSDESSDLAIASGDEPPDPVVELEEAGRR